ncbi:hypothetical protein [Flectobacillus major]|jgi:hypothetical protein|uniref:hypothetical protein n=1 Tax=Flectobacillus major TaxID=103 RepID=UPI000416D5E3|nr:hypothetical protein [Flectobacillus major]
MKKIIIPVLLLGIATSCNKAQEEDQQKKLIEEVIAVHDEVMPKMDVIMSLKGQLDSVSKVSKDSIKAKELFVQLDSADIKMSNWMAEYNPESVKGKGIEEALKYLEGEKKKINEVKVLTNTSIANAKQFLGK